MLCPFRYDLGLDLSTTSDSWPPKNCKQGPVDTHEPTWRSRVGLGMNHRGWQDESFQQLVAIFKSFVCKVSEQKNGRFVSMLCER